MSKLHEILHKLPLGLFILLSIKGLFIQPGLHDIMLASVLGLISGYFYKERQTEDITKLQNKIDELDNHVSKESDDVSSLKKEFSLLKNDLNSIKLFKNR